jgi:hypothetical protein
MESNKLIAEFMGEHLTEISINSFMDEYEHDRISWHSLEYRRSWDWLMPVVEKCYATEIPDDSNLHGDISCELLECDIHGTHKAVVEFIKWYNEQLENDWDMACDMDREPDMEENIKKWYNENK